MDLSTPEITRYGYDLLGNLIRQDIPNGVITIYEYDALNRLDKLTHYKPDSAGVVSPDQPLDTNLSDNPKVAEFD